MEITDIIKEENKVYSKPELLEEVHMHYCPGCSHGVVHKILAEVIAEMGLTEDEFIAKIYTDSDPKHLNQ